MSTERVKVDSASSVHSTAPIKPPEKKKGEDETSTSSRTSATGQEALKKGDKSSKKSLSAWKWIKGAGTWIKNQFKKIFSIFRSKDKKTEEKAEKSDPIVKSAEKPARSSSHHTDDTSKKGPTSLHSSITTIIGEDPALTSSLFETPGGPPDLDAHEQFKSDVNSTVSTLNDFINDPQFDDWNNTETLFLKKIDLLVLKEACENAIDEGLAPKLHEDYEQHLENISTTELLLNEMLDDPNIKSDLQRQIQIRIRVLKEQQEDIRDLKAVLRENPLEENSDLKETENEFNENLQNLFQVLILASAPCANIAKLKEEFELLRLGFERADVDPVKKPRDVGGLSNMTNSCYINSSLQMLRANNMLQQALDNFKPLSNEQIELLNDRDKSRYQSKLLVLAALKEIVTLLEAEKTASSGDPSEISEKIDTALLGLRFATFESQGPFDYQGILRQQDGAEFILSLLDTLESKIDISTQKTSPDRSYEVDSSESQLKLTFESTSKSQPLQSLINRFFETSGIATHQDKISLKSSPEFIPLALSRFVYPTNKQKEHRYFKGQALAKVVAHEMVTEADVQKALAPYRLRHPEMSEADSYDLIKDRLTRHKVREVQKNDMKEFKALTSDEKAAKLVEMSQGHDYDDSIKILAPITVSDDGIVSLSKGYNDEFKHDYEVVAFQVHVGHLPNSGHYIAFRKEDGVWKKFDDEAVTVVNPDELTREMGQAYNLLLKKVSPPPLAAAIEL